MATCKHCGREIEGAGGLDMMTGERAGWRHAETLRYSCNPQARPFTVATPSEVSE